MPVQVEDDDGQVIVLAKADGGGVHHPEALLQDLHVADLVEHLGVFDDDGIGVVDAVHLGRFQDDVGLDLHRPQGSGGIRSEVRIAGAGAENDHAVFFHVADGAASDEGLGNLMHFDRRHDAAVDAALLESVLQRERVDHGGEHAHVVGGDAVHLSGLLGDAAEKISTADDDGNLYAERVDILDLGGNFVNADGIDTETLVRGQGFAGQLQKNALKNGIGHRYPILILRYL